MIDSLIADYEGKRYTLYEDPYNPYESIYIRAAFENGCMVLTDDEYEHGPDGGWSCEAMEFDRENTRKVIAVLLERGYDPLAVLKSMLSYEQRTRTFKKLCEERDIPFIRKFFI